MSSLTLSKKVSIALLLKKRQFISWLKMDL